MDNLVPFQERLAKLKEAHSDSVKLVEVLPDRRSLVVLTGLIGILGSTRDA
jgi:hypothetical protein